jgi:hypothetical protein
MAVTDLEVFTIYLLLKREAHISSAYRQINEKIYNVYYGIS